MRQLLDLCHFYSACGSIIFETGEETDIGGAREINDIFLFS